jgi:hypothetical protein
MGAREILIEVAGNAQEFSEAMLGFRSGTRKLAYSVLGYAREADIE